LTPSGLYNTYNSSWALVLLETRRDDNAPVAIETEDTGESSALPGFVVVGAGVGVEGLYGDHVGVDGAVGVRYDLYAVYVGGGLMVGQRIGVYGGGADKILIVTGFV